MPGPYLDLLPDLRPDLKLDCLPTTAVTLQNSYGRNPTKYRVAAIRVRSFPTSRWCRCSGRGGSDIIGSGCDVGDTTTALTGNRQIAAAVAAVTAAAKTGLLL